MNIFYLDKDITKCAQAHCDKHVIKMIHEYTQILLTVCNKKGLDTPYKPTHENHPCVLWAEESIGNWIWLFYLTEALNEEYMYRWDTGNHRSYLVLNEYMEHNKIENAFKGETNTYRLTTRPQCLNSKIPQHPITAYRNYYLLDKAHLLNYTKRKKPDWMVHYE